MVSYTTLSTDNPQSTSVAEVQDKGHNCNNIAFSKTQINSKLTQDHFWKTGLRVTQNQVAKKELGDFWSSRHYLLSAGITGVQPSAGLCGGMDAVQPSDGLCGGMDAV